MANPATLHAALVARLETITTVTTYDGDVPTTPPADDEGRVYPYVVVWGAPGWTDADARDLNGDADGALTYPPRLTVTAGDVGWCLEATNLVRTALEGHRLVPGAGPLREDPIDLGVMKDPDATPVRHYTPLIFRCQAP